MKINLGKLSEEYELKYVAYIISKYKYKRVAIQLPDKNLDVSIYIVNIIKRELTENGIVPHKNGIVPNENGIVPHKNGIVSNENGIIPNENGIVPNEKKVNTLPSHKCLCEHTKVEENGRTTNRECVDETKETTFYVLGDTTLNECCEDFVSADHVKADCLIHFGNSCQSFLIPYIPSISIFPKKQLKPCFFTNIKKFIKENKSTAKEKKTHIILCDVSYNEVLNDIVFAFVDKEQLKIEENEKENEKEHENEDAFCIEAIRFDARGGVNKRIKDHTQGYTNGHINVRLNNKLYYNGLNRKEKDTTTNAANGEMESEKELKKELELINKQEIGRENERETEKIENIENIEKIEKIENIQNIENIENIENTEKTTLLFTGVIVGIHKIASNLENHTYYGFSNNAIAFNTQQDLEKDFLFICGRLMCQIFYDPNRKRIIYKALESHVDLNSQTTEVFIFPKEEQNMEKDPFLNRCVLELGCDYSNDNVYIYKGHSTRNDMDDINMDVDMDIDNDKDKVKDKGMNKDECINTYMDEGGKQVVFSKATKIINSLLLKRYSLISKSKEVECFGIIIGNVNLCKNIELRRLINYILRKRKKTCFTIATNKLNVAKLENFHDIDMYILLTCPENSLLKIENCSKSIINPYELFVALDLIEWTGKYLFEFSDLLNVNSLKTEMEKMKTIKNDKYILWKSTLPLMSLQSHETNVLKNKSDPAEKEKKDGKEEEDKEKIEEKEKYMSISNEEYEGLLEPNTSISLENQKKFIQRFHEKSKMCSYFIETLKENDKREFKGVEMNYNTDTITKAVQGLSGIAQCYQTDLKFTNHDRVKIKQQDTRTD